MFCQECFTTAEEIIVECGDLPDTCPDCGGEWINVFDADDFEVISQEEECN